MGKRKNIVIQNVHVEDYAAEGKSISRFEGKVIFIEKAVPGDVVDVRLVKNKREWAEGYPVHFHSFSPERVIPFCSHFGVCGGCQWQMLPYEKQLKFKQKQVEDALRRIGKINLPEISSILGADETIYYRNKLEYTFSTKEFVPFPESQSPTLPKGRKAIGTPNGGEPHSAPQDEGESLSPTLPEGKGLGAPSVSPNGGEPHTAPNDGDESLSPTLPEGKGHQHTDPKAEKTSDNKTIINKRNRNFRYHTADPSVYGLMKEYAIIQKQNQTQAEAALWQLLKGKKLAGHKFRRQHIILHFIADFVCLRKKLIIELDGNIHDIPQNKISDEQRTTILKANEYHVLRFRNEEVIRETESVLSKITDALNHLPDAHSSTEDEEVLSFGEDLGEAASYGASGFHAKGFFDKVVEIEKCWLQHEPTNSIRNTIAAFARANHYSFYDFRTHRGFLRNIQVRICTTGEVMVNIVFGPGEDDVDERRNSLLDYLLHAVPGITTLLYTINPKFNDSLHDLQPVIFYGKGYIMEKLSAGSGGDYFEFKIGPKSFFQTNTLQAQKLYTIAGEFAELKGSETIFDLYCGTGSIGIFLSKKAKKVIGVEIMEEAIKDARENAAINQISHAEFFTGDVIKICNEDFFSVHGRPDVIITDPPRAGMHEKLVRKIIEIEAPVIVYVSCNPATQSRDLALLDEKYKVSRVQPVDMFPHTHHIENVVQLKLK